MDGIALLRTDGIALLRADPHGLYGSGMYDFALVELELGTRVAMALDDEAIFGPDLYHL